MTIVPHAIRRRTSVRALVVLVGMLASLMAALPLDASMRARNDPRRALARQEQQIRRGQSLLRRVLRDPRASAEVRQKAAELQAMLDQRAQRLARLEALHRDFMAQHKAEIDELEQLRRRAYELDQRLDTAREGVLKSSESDITQLKANSERAADLVEQLRAAYDAQRRARRPQP